MGKGGFQLKVPQRTVLRPELFAASFPVPQVRGMLVEVNANLMGLGLSTHKLPLRRGLLVDGNL